MILSGNREKSTAYKAETKVTILYIDDSTDVDVFYKIVYGNIHKVLNL